jgi:hypothetical protein
MNAEHEQIRRRLAEALAQATEGLPMATALQCADAAVRAAQATPADAREPAMGDVLRRCIPWLPAYAMKINAAAMAKLLAGVKVDPAADAPPAAPARSAWNDDDLDEPKAGWLGRKKKGAK